MSENIPNPNTTTGSSHSCMNEARLTAIETKLKNKRYELNDLDEKLNEQSKSLTKLTNEVTRLATLLSESQNNRATQGDKIDKLEIQVAQLNSTLTTLKWVLTVFIALFGGVGVFLITSLIQMIH